MDSKREYSDLSTHFGSEEFIIPLQSDCRFMLTLSGVNYRIYEFKFTAENLTSPAGQAPIVEDILRQGKKIVKARVLFPLYQIKNPIILRRYNINPSAEGHFLTYDNQQPALVYFRFNDGTRQTLQIHPTSRPSFEELCLRLGEIVDCYFRATFVANDWSEGIRKHYTQATYDGYAIDHNGTFQRISREHKDHFNLVDICCGNGRFLLNHVKGQPNICWIGIDKSKINIQEAQKQDQENKDRYIQGDIFDIVAIVEKCMKEGLLNRKYPIIITAFGAINRFVLPNGIIAAKVLQVVHKLPGLIGVFGSGAGDLLIPPFVAKRIGFELTTKFKAPPGEASKINRPFILKPLDAKIILKNKRGKLEKSGTLDLSHSTNPLELLKDSAIKNAINKSIREDKKPVTINLSYCILSPELLNYIATELMDFYNEGDIRLIYFDSDKDQVDLFRKKFFHKMNHIETYSLRDFDSDIFLVASLSFLNSVNPYHEITRKITEICDYFEMVKFDHTQLLCTQPKLDLVYDRTPMDQLIFIEKTLFDHKAFNNFINKDLRTPMEVNFKISDGAKNIIRLYFILRKLKTEITPDIYGIIISHNMALAKVWPILEEKGNEGLNHFRALFALPPLKILEAISAIHSEKEAPLPQQPALKFKEDKEKTSPLAGPTDSEYLPLAEKLGNNQQQQHKISLCVRPKTS